ncbi:hypothetical protein Gpo141_00012550 [Globisporangium polare]
MDVSQLLSAPLGTAHSNDYEEGDNNNNNNNRTADDAKAAAVVAVSFEPGEPSPSSSATQTSLTPYARPRSIVKTAGPAKTAKRGAQRNASAVTHAAAAVQPVKGGVMKAPVKRIRKRMLSAKQKQRWLEKEADNSQIYNLTLDVNELKQQLQYFQVQKSLHATRMLVARQNLSGGALRTVDMFFKLFYRGLRDWNEEEANFVYSCTDEQLALGTAAVGRHMLLEQWGRYTQLFQIHSFVNSSMDLLSMDPDCVIVQCNGQFEGKLSRQAIEAVFPHILGDEELLARVMESKFICPAKTLLYFDASGRIVRYDAHADIFEGLNMLLTENPRDVIAMMANARINDASMIPSVEESGDMSAMEYLSDSSASSVSSASTSRAASPSQVDNLLLSPAKDQKRGDRHSVDFLLS